MILSIYFLSLLFFVLGWIYYSRPQTIARINVFFRQKVFNDRYILLKRKKIGILFFTIACLLCVSAFVFSADAKKKRKIPSNSINKEIIFDVISYYRKGLSETPDNTELLTKTGYAFEALGEKNRASAIWKRILALDPGNETAKKRLNAKY